MSKKIITRLFNYAKTAGAHHLIITSQPDHLSLDCHFPDESRQSLRLPKKLEAEFMANLRQILAIAPGELTTKKYGKIINKDCQLNFYLTVLPEADGEKIIISIINCPHKLWRLSQLGLTAENQKILKQALRARAGLIIISAPAENGKSATLQALLAASNDPRSDIYLLSKAAEQIIPGINTLPLTAANWDKILEHQSEIIGIDDLDDDWALRKAWRTAVSGRLVLGTMTASSSQAAAKKLAQLPPLKLKAGAPKIIINQRLVDLKRKKSPKSKDQRQIIGQFELLKV